MKKYIIILSALALAAGCNKEVEVPGTQLPDVPEGAFRAGFANAGATKVAFDTQAYKLTWEKADSISLFRSSYGEKFILEGEGGSSSGIFVPADPDAFVAGNPLEVNYALYPYDQNHSLTSVDGQECFYLYQNTSTSMEQYICAPDANPLMAVTTSSQDRHLCFKSVYGYLVVPVCGSVKVHSVNLSSNGGEPVSGTMYVKASPGGEPEIIRKYGSPYRTLSYLDPVQLSESSATDFWFALPPGTFESGFSVDLVLETENGDIYTESRSTPISRTIRRNVVNRMAPISLETALSDWQYFTNPDGTVATVTFTQNWWEDTVTARIKYQEAPWGDRYCVTETDPFVGNDGKTWYGFFHTAENESEATELQFTWHASRGNELELPYQSTGWYYTNYSAYVNLSDYASYFIHRGDITDWWSISDYPRGYYDGNGGFFFYVYKFYMDNVGGWTVNDYDIVGEADGYYRPKAEIEISYDYEYQDERKVTVSAQEDVHTIFYQWYPGTLSNSSAASLAEDLRSSGTNAMSMDNGPVTLSLSQPNSGYYSLVVGSDFGTWKLITLEYAVPGDKDVVLDVSCAEVGTTSASLVISGSALTDVKAMMVKMSDFQANSTAYMNAARSTSSLDVNSVVSGGLTYTAEGLTPDTRYALVVWATNGLKMDWVVLSFHTQEASWTWLGTGTLTDDVAGPLFSMDPATVPCQVYEMTDIPGMFKVNGYQKALIAYYFEEEESAFDEYEGVYWENTDLLIDATDPNAVKIYLQNYGVCFSERYGFLWLSSMYNGKALSNGVYANGVISFPTAKGLCCGFNGELSYTSNFNAAFQVTLPGVSSSAGVSRPSAKRKLSMEPLKEFRLPFES